MAAEPTTTAARIAPYVSDQTLGIGHVDVQQIDLSAFETKLTALLQASKLDPDLQQQALAHMKLMHAVAAGWLAGFEKAGGRHLYLLTTVAELSQGPGFVIAPIEKGGDARAISMQLGGNADGQAPKRGGWPQVAVALDGVAYLGTSAALDQLRAAAPAARPDVDSAFTAAGDSALQLLIVPNDDTRKVIEGLIPNLPRELGNAPTTVLTHGVRWAVASFNFTPQLSFKLTIQSQDAQSAKALGDLLNTARKVVASVPELREHFPDLDQSLGMLAPRVVGDRLEISLSDEQFSKLISGPIVAAAHIARTKAQAAVAMSNMKQILLGCIMYADEHQAKWPEKLEEIEKYVNGAQQIVVNPRQPEEKIGFVYIKPAEDALKQPASTLVMHERLSVKGGRLIAGYADGHVQLLTPDELRSQLKAAQP
jgi:hypothetical protein